MIMNWQKAYFEGKRQTTRLNQDLTLCHTIKNLKTLWGFCSFYRRLNQMDKCTHEVRKQRWKNIIGQCLQRPEGMTVKQWLDENNICEQTYYHWLKRIRQETYELATTSTNTAYVKTVPREVTFAEVPLPAMEPAMPSANGFRPDITIQTGSMLIGVSNTASDSLLNKLLEVIGHAR